MAISRKHSEVGVMEIDVAPVVTNTHTAEKWREYAKNNLLVKCDNTSTAARGNGLTPVEICTASTDVPIGILRSVVGDPSDFPKKFTACIAIKAYDCNVAGAGTGELADADFGRRIKPDANAKASIVTSGGFGRVKGGDKANLRIAFDFIDNFR